ncbi:hypothetical protein OH76DRAFT_476930 [Lentinus brumalis]|uniref:Uncharacterized protein n=1 Tax=Lentinus brumalis TaxID=2498619 RepID=A0A371DBT5_9APHY|nr:hypothetical protein OH76DRAFT_476930 [Polyporus brumalis]
MRFSAPCGWRSPRAKESDQAPGLRSLRVQEAHTNVPLATGRRPPFSDQGSTSPEERIASYMILYLTVLQPNGMWHQVVPGSIAQVKSPVGAPTPWKCGMGVVLTPVATKWLVLIDQQISRHRRWLQSPEPRTIYDDEMQGEVSVGGSINLSPVLLTTLLKSGDSDPIQIWEPEIMQPQV